MKFILIILISNLFSQFTLYKGNDYLRFAGNVSIYYNHRFYLENEDNFKKTSSKKKGQINEDFDETPPQNASLSGQVRELFITLDDGRTGYKKWEWVADETLDEGGEWFPLGSFGDGSVYIPGVGSIYNLKETDNYLLKKNISSSEKSETETPNIELKSIENNFKIFDMRNLYSSSKIKQQGFKYYSVGK